MLTILETRYMEQMPRLMHELIEELGKLTKEVEELNKKLDKKED